MQFLKQTPQLLTYIGFYSTFTSTGKIDVVKAFTSKKRAKNIERRKGKRKYGSAEGITFCSLKERPIVKDVVYSRFRKGDLCVFCPCKYIRSKETNNENLFTANIFESGP